MSKHTERNEMKVYIVTKCEKIVKVYNSKETADREILKYIDSQIFYTLNDFKIIIKDVF